MIKHIILWRYTEAAEDFGRDRLIKELNKRFKSLIGQINGLRVINVRACDAKGDSGYHDLMLYAEFDDVQSLEGYMAHPKHAEIREWDKKYVCDRAGFDFEE